MTENPELPSAPPTPTPKPPEVSGVFGVLIIAQLLVLATGCLLGTMFGVGRVAADGTRASPQDIQAQLLGSPDFLLAALVATQLAMALALWKAPRSFETIPAGGMRARLGWSEEPVRWLFVLVALAGTWACSPLVLVPLRLLRGPPTGALAQFSKAAEEMGDVPFAAFLLFGSVGAGVLEELLFRGFAQRRLVERWGAVRGVLVTAALFGLWHWDFEQGLYAFVVGLWLGAVAVHTRSTVPGALAHVGNNALSFVGTRLVGGQSDFPEPAYVLIGAAVLAGAAWALVLLTRREARGVAPGP